MRNLQKIAEQGNSELYELVARECTVMACTLTGHYVTVNRNELLSLMEDEPFRFIILPKGEYLQNEETIVIY